MNIIEKLTKKIILSENAEKMYYYRSLPRATKRTTLKCHMWNKLSVSPQSGPVLTYAVCVPLLQKVPIYLVVDRRDEDFVHHLAATLLHCWAISNKKRLPKN